ncbi:3-oxoacyl-ACP reductase FabG [Angustibacter luteus]|uniref:3-oxoacyl-ACP reductase FabG n=1 Tax=Angustibacter luteus TaxID=658456 RepID=A0ABW1JAW8_9ACTN
MGALDGRVALVTGAARGIGAATARRLAADGAKVALLDLDESAAAATAKDIASEVSADAIGVGADVRDPEAVQRAVDTVVERLGGLHILVNNAGVTRDNLLFKLSEEDWDTVIGVHLKGAYLMSKAAQQHFVAQKHGRIVNLSSVSALGNRGQANYSAAKMGLQGFTRTLAIELGPFGVTVNAVAPGFVVTEMTDATAARLGITPDQLREVSAQAAPVRRVGYPDDIANAIAFFASDAASFVTGQTLYVDGGAKL